jgi:hypothetical protein
MAQVHVESTESLKEHITTQMVEELIEKVTQVKSKWEELEGKFHDLEKVMQVRKLPEWLGTSHMSVLGAYWCRTILGERSILGAGLILEEKVYFWSVHLRRKERNMQKKKEKQCGVHAYRTNYVRVRVFDKYCNRYNPVE